MFRLADESSMVRMEGALRRAREQSDSLFAWWWNILLLIAVVGGFVLFLQVRRNTPIVEEKRIAFEPTTWYSATRNVRSEEYGSQLQPFEVEARNGLPGYDSGGSQVQVQ